jgi:hypothetical protein
MGKRTGCAGPWVGSQADVTDAVFGHVVSIERINALQSVNVCVRRGLARRVVKRCRNHAFNKSSIAIRSCGIALLRAADEVEKHVAALLPIARRFLPFLQRRLWIARRFIGLRQL